MVESTLKIRQINTERNLIRIRIRIMKMMVMIDGHKDDGDDHKEGDPP